MRTSRLMSFGRLNIRGKYTVNGRILGSADVQRDLEVQGCSSLKVSTQVARVARKTYTMLVLIGQGVEYNSW